MCEVSSKGRTSLEIEQTVLVTNFWNSRILMETFKLANLTNYSMAIVLVHARMKEQTNVDTDT